MIRRGAIGAALAALLAARIAGAAPSPPVPIPNVNVSPAPAFIGQPAVPVGALGICAARVSNDSMFQRPWLLRTRFKLGSFRLRRAISMRAPSRERNRKFAVTLSERNSGSELNAGSSSIAKFSRSNPGWGSR